MRIVEPQDPRKSIRKHVERSLKNKYSMDIQEGELQELWKYFSDTGYENDTHVILALGAREIPIWPSTEGYVLLDSIFELSASIEGYENICLIESPPTVLKVIRRDGEDMIMSLSESVHGQYDSFRCPLPLLVKELNAFTSWSMEHIDNLCQLLPDNTDMAMYREKVRAIDYWLANIQRVVS